MLNENHSQWTQCEFTANKEMGAFCENADKSVTTYGNVEAPIWYNHM